MNRPFPIALAVTLAAALTTAAGSGQKPQDWDGSRVTPVHRIPLKDEFNQVIIPGEPNPLPISSRNTCAPCHDYDTVRRGLHFNADREEAVPGRPGEPWIWLDETTGTVLPLSYRGWPGTWQPSALGLAAWDFTRLFARHMTGGGIAEPALEARASHSRWEVSGNLEINCLACHNASRRQSHSEWARQVLRENFRWAATAAAGLGEVGGMALRLPSTWDIIDGPNPDDSEYAVVPTVAYRRGDFDSAHNVDFEIVHRPGDDRCLVCHSTSPAGIPQFSADSDVHSSAGLLCADCHRNDLGHGMLRGYEGEARDTGRAVADQFTCRGCHLGFEDGKKGGGGVGRLGAPYPEHKGFPKVHFERLSCTVCHSGPPPAGEPTRVRTSRANRLGIYGVARWDTPLPDLLAPVFLRREEGRLTPHRIMWPAFWGRRASEGVVPLRPDEVTEAVGDLLLSIERAARLLSALALTLDLGGEPLLVTGGRVFRVNMDGGLDVEDQAGKDLAADPLWLVRTEQGDVPLIPAFVPDAEPPDPEGETRIQAVLEALAAMENRPGEPVVMIRGGLYRLVEGFLEKQEAPAEEDVPPTPAWWRNEALVPLISEFDLRTIRGTVGTPSLLTEEQAELALVALAGENDGGDYVYVSGGRMFFLDEDGRLAAEQNPAAEPVSWPLAHNVRSARQSLGITGCTDCHSGGSDFFFASIRARGPLATDRGAVRSASAFMGMDAPFQRIYGLSFLVRPVLKWLLGAASLLVGLLLLTAAALAMGRLAGLLEKRR